MGSLPSMTMHDPVPMDSRSPENPTPMPGGDEPLVADKTDEALDQEAEERWKEESPAPEPNFELTPVRGAEENEEPSPLPESTSLPLPPNEPDEYEPGMGGPGERMHDDPDDEPEGEGD